MLNVKLFYFAFYIRVQIKTEPSNCNKSTVVFHFKNFFVLYIGLFNKTLSLLLIEIDLVLWGITLKILLQCFEVVV